LTLVGGNCIGTRPDLPEAELRLGDHVSLGINAVIIGPVRIGNRVVVGAGAVVVDDCPDGVVMIGVPARPTGAAAPDPRPASAS
jgi:serine acetyltransferase